MSSKRLRKNNMNRRFALLFTFLLYVGLIKAQVNHYSIPESGTYQNNITIVSQVYLDDVEVQSEDYELGAFVGDESRGTDRVTLWNNTYYRAWPIIYYTKGGDKVIFKLYDNVNAKEYVLYSATIYDEDEGEMVDMPSKITDLQDYIESNSNSKPAVFRFSSTTNLVINQYTTNGGWYLIASPLNAAETNPTTVTNMLSNDYDLYYFDQTGGNYDKEWINYKESSSSTNPGFKLVPGKGYLYANSGDGVSEKTTLTFIGAPYNGTGVVELSRATTVAHEKMKGWNLIGNSFTTAKTIGGRGYYRMNPVGRSELIAGTGNIDAMEGIFVYYDPEDDNEANREETVTFTNPSLKRAEGDDMVLLTLNRNNDGTIDRVIVRFDEGGTLPKYTLRDNSTIIYIPQADKDYAVVKGSATNVFPVNFKTEDFGVYTLSSDIAGANVDYMHLIDKITGEDVDMLLEGEYSFVAAPVDREDRFILRLNYSGYFDNESDIFAYQNGSDIVVCGEGTLQVFDVMGRFVTSYEVNGVQSIQAMPMGVYIFRMLGDDVKTQKIYVR
jgi:hypothetical protein